MLKAVYGLINLLAITCSGRFISGFPGKVPFVILISVLFFGGGEWWSKTLLTRRKEVHKTQMPAQRVR